MRYFIALILTLTAFPVRAEPIKVEPLEQCIAFVDISGRIENILKSDLSIAMSKVKKLEARVIMLEEAAKETEK